MFAPYVERDRDNHHLVYRSIYIHTMGLRHIQCVYQSQDYLLMFSSVCSRINGWVNICDAGDLRRRPAHYDVTVMYIVSNSSTATFTGQLSLKCFSSAYGQILTSWRTFVLIRTARSRLPQFSLKMPDYEQRFAGGVPGLRSLPRGTDLQERSVLVGSIRRHVADVIIAWRRPTCYWKAK